MADGPARGIEPVTLPENLSRAGDAGRLGGRVPLILAGLLAVLALGVAAVLTTAGGGAPALKQSAASATAGPSVASLAASRGVGADQRAFWASGSRNRLLAVNRAQHMRATFTARGVTVSVPGGTVGLALRGVGRGASLQPTSPVSPAAQANRATYARGGLSEWYANGPLGLEQGLTLKAAPTGSGNELNFSYGLTGASAQLKDGQLLFDSSNGTKLLRYSGLSATDARGHTLPSQLQLDGNRLTLKVNGQGAHYPITVDPLMQVATLTASDSKQAGEFGWTVALSGSTMVVGDPQADASSSGGTAPGAAYVFTEPSSGWADATQNAKLVAPASAGSILLGSGVAVEGQTAFVVGDQANGNEGAIWVFTDSSGSWKFTKLLTPSTATDLVGFGVAAITVSGTNLFVGAPELGSGEEGGVYVFTEPKGGWADATQTATLTPKDTNLDWMGASVAVSGSTLVVGAPFVGSDLNGALYVFNEPAGGWKDGHQSVILSPPAGSASDNGQLGDSVGFSSDGSTIAAGAPLTTDGSTGSAGEVDVYAKKGPAWKAARPSAVLTPSDPTNRGLFGLRLTFGAFPTSAADAAKATASGASPSTVDTIFVGTGSGTGVYRFAQPPGGWSSTSGSAAMGLESASSFSLALGGGYLLEGNDNSVTSSDPPVINPGQVNAFDAAAESTTSVACTPELGDSRIGDVVHGDGDRRLGQRSGGADRHRHLYVHR